MKTVFAITANNVTLDFAEKMIDLNLGVKIHWGESLYTSGLSIVVGISPMRSTFARKVKCKSIENHNQGWG